MTNPETTALFKSHLRESFIEFFAINYPIKNIIEFAKLEFESQLGIYIRYFNEIHNLEWFATKYSIAIGYFDGTRNPKQYEQFLKTSKSPFIIEIDIKNTTNNSIATHSEAMINTLNYIIKPF